MSIELSIITDLLVTQPGVVWTALQGSHPNLLTGSRVCWCYETKCTLDDIVSEIARRGKPHFGIAFNENSLPEIAYGHVRNHSLSRIDISGVVDDIEDSQSWVEPFLLQPNVRHAWMFDVEYQYWQNATDPQEYTAVGRSYAGLPMKSNGLPIPLEQQVIDTSQNPGRRVLRDGYVEAVGAVMWLGEQFWPLTGASKQDVLAADWLQCEQFPQDVLRIQAADVPFTTAEGASGDLQDKLRSLLFPQSQ